MYKINTEEMSQIVKYMFKNNAKRPVLFLGASGIGKTAILGSIADKLGIGFIDFRLTTRSNVDLKGVPQPDKNKKFTVWLQDGSLPDVGRHGERGILFFDEITNVRDLTVQTMMYQLLNERKLGEYSLPPGWIIVLAGNRAEDGGDYEELLAPLVNRMDIYEVDFDPDFWISWALNNGVNPFVISYLNEHKGDYHTYSPEESSDMLFATPRSWVAVSDHINRTENTEFSFMRNTLVRGVLPTAIANQFIEYLTNSDRLPPIAQILTGEVTANDVPEEKKSAQILIVNFFASNLMAEFNQINGDSKKSEEFNHKLNRAFTFCKESNFSTVIVLMLASYLYRSGDGLMYGKLAHILQRDDMTELADLLRKKQDLSKKYEK